MGCIESTPVVEQPQRKHVVYTAYPVNQNQTINYPPKQTEDPVNYSGYNQQQPYNPNLTNNNYQPQYYPPQQTYLQNSYIVQQQYPYRQQNYSQYQYPYTYPQPTAPPYYQNTNQPSMLGTFGAVVGGVIVGEAVSDILGFD